MKNVVIVVILIFCVVVLICHLWKFLLHVVSNYLIYNVYNPSNFYIYLIVEQIINISKTSQRTIAVYLFILNE